MVMKRSINNLFAFFLITISSPLPFFPLKR
jgi:hypothetical protein